MKKFRALKKFILGRTIFLPGDLCYQIDDKIQTLATIAQLKTDGYIEDLEA